MEKSIANGGEKVYEFMDFTPETWYTSVRIYGLYTGNVVH